MICVGESEAIICKGDFKPASIYKGDTFIAGAQNTLFEGELISAENTYNAPIEVEVSGKTEQEQSVWGTNLVTNGDFSDYVTGWNAINAIISASSNIAKSLATAQYGGMQQNYYDYSELKGHIMYACAWLKSDTRDTYMAFLNDGVDQAVVRPSIYGSFEFLSASRVISTSATKLFNKVQDGRTADWTECQVKNVLMLDLTAIFGAGNEPNKEQVDSMLSQYQNNWFDGDGKLTDDIVTYIANSPSPNYPSDIEAVLSGTSANVSDVNNAIQYSATLDRDLYAIKVDALSALCNYIDGNGQGWCADKISRTNNTVLHKQHVAYIASYNGETITTPYMSTTGELTTGATVIYTLSTPIETDITSTTFGQALLSIHSIPQHTNIFTTPASGGLVPNIKTTMKTY